MCFVVIVLGKAVYFFSPLPLSKSRLAVKAKQMHLNWNPLGFLSELSQHRSKKKDHRSFEEVFLDGQIGQSEWDLVTKRAKLQH